MLANDEIAAITATPAFDVLVSLADAGVEFKLEGARVLFRHHQGLVTEEHRRALVADHGSARLLVPMLNDPGVRARWQVFRAAFDEAPANVIPSNVFLPGTPYLKGICFSCGDRLRQPLFRRCWRCSLAWRLASRGCSCRASARACDRARVM